MNILNLKSTIVALAVGVIVGGGLGFYTKGQFAKADEVAHADKVVKQSAGNVIYALKKSESVDVAVQKLGAETQQVKTAVHSRIAKQKEIQNAAQKLSPDVVQNCPDFTLDAGTVRLLNAARQGFAVDTAGSSDEALSAATAIGLERLVDVDIETVRLYRDLATRHDALVDAVEEKLKQQAE